MRIVSIRAKNVSLPSSVRTADIKFDEMTATALVIESDVIRNGKAVCGLAFSSVGRYGHGGLLRERFIPRLLAATPDAYLNENGEGVDPFKAWAIVMRNEKAGGHGERGGAVGLIDAALWDLQSKLEGKPLWSLLQERFGMAAGAFSETYASGGHYRPENDLGGLTDDIRKFIDLGYTKFKIKAGGQSLREDCQRIEAVLALLPNSDALAIDCNCGFDSESVSGSLRELRTYGLAWIEEPVEPLDYALYSEAVEQYDLPIATGENVFSLADTKNLVRYAGLRPDRDLLNMDILHSYGLVEYLRILQALAEQGWSRKSCFPHAGHLFALHVCCGLGLGAHETAPLHHPIGGFAPDTRLDGGRIHLSDAPGVGLEHKASFAPVFADLLSA